MKSLPSHNLASRKSKQRGVTLVIVTALLAILAAFATGFYTLTKDQTLLRLNPTWRLLAIWVRVLPK